MVTTNKGEWILQSGGSEYGPYSLEELILILQSGKLEGEKFVWKSGLNNWFRVENEIDLAEKIPLNIERSKEFVIERGNNIRNHIRSTLIATVAISTEAGRYIGICFDLSQSGMAVTDLHVVNLKQNQIHDILIIPLVATHVKPFASKARVAWIDPAKKSAGFQFTSELDKASVVNYLKSRQKGYG